jgi:hypothetical protein
VCIANEVTPQACKHQFKESEERFRSLSNNACNIFIIEPNEEASISYWNKTGLHTKF